LASTQPRGHRPISAEDAQAEWRWRQLTFELIERLRLRRAAAAAGGSAAEEMWLCPHHCSQWQQAGQV